MDIQVGFALAESTVSLSEYRKLRNENTALKSEVKKLMASNTDSPKLLLVLDQALNLINDGEYARATGVLTHLKQQLRAGA